MGRAAQSHIEQHYTWAHATAKLEALYKDLGLQTDGLRNHW
jgi:hypothetical protein